MDMNQQAQAEFQIYLDRRRAVIIDRIAAMVLALVGTFLVVAFLL